MFGRSLFRKKEFSFQLKKGVVVVKDIGVLKNVGNQMKFLSKSKSQKVIDETIGAKKSWRQRLVELTGS